MSEAHEFAHVSGDRLHRFQPYNDHRHDVATHDRLSSRPSSGPHHRSNQHQATSDRSHRRQQHNDQRHDVAATSGSGRLSPQPSLGPRRPSNQPQASSDRRHMIQHHNDHRHDVATHDRLSSRLSSSPHRPSNQPRPSHQVYRESYDSYGPQQTLARDQTRRPDDRDREIKPGPGSRPQNPSRGVYHDFAREGRDRPAPSRFDSPPQTQGSDRDQQSSYHSLTRGGGHSRGQSLQREPDVTSDRGQSHHPRRFTGTSFQPPQQICNKPPFHEKVKLNTEDAEKLVTHGGQSIDPHVELRCGNCGHRGHRLIDCIWPDLSGQISGCPLCNTKLHYLDECARVSQLSKAQLYNLLIHRRGNRPAIASRTPWVDLVMEAATASIGIKDPRGGPFPWTKDFAKSQGHVWCKHENRSGPLWEFYDYRAGKEGRMPLPTDPKTKNLEKVLSSVEELRRTEVHLGLGQNALTL
ncbi:hypothetical protein CGCS363_v002349 [Colletotrichum siamense]|uniref:uncharacterized protein n=1 Tax=Colletotrichum siamense TaxID=690259 RepID=UPI001872F5E1|nr:uncharacterized protein CGCS363_v002349 [Colletotrichum siamense]KAF5511617.1 hypothetical protein CGCS363_v002349 [Colletotrichum siamense]